MFKMHVYHVYRRFNERIRIGDYCDPVDHVDFARRIFLSYTLRHGGLCLLTYNQYYIVKSYDIHEPYRNMMGCCLVRTFSEDFKVS